jgi:hypothetical protein
MKRHFQCLLLGLCAATLHADTTPVKPSAGSRTTTPNLNWLVPLGDPAGIADMKFCTLGNISIALLPPQTGNSGKVLMTDGTTVSWQNVGAGTVFSVGLAMPGIFNVANSPVIDSDTLAVTLATQNANLVWAGPASGAAATPTFRSLVAADIPSLAALYQPLHATLTAIAAFTPAAEDSVLILAGGSGDAAPVLRTYTTLAGSLINEIGGFPSLGSGAARSLWDVPNDVAGMQIADGVLSFLLPLQGVYFSDGASGQTVFRTAIAAAKAGANTDLTKLTGLADGSLAAPSLAAASAPLKGWYFDPSEGIWTLGIGDGTNWAVKIYANYGNIRGQGTAEFNSFKLYSNLAAISNAASGLFVSDPDTALDWRFKINGTEVVKYVAGGAEFSQVPKAPTAATGTSTTQLATTAFVATALAWEIKTADFTAVAGHRYQVDTSGGAITATLPASMAAGERIEFEDAGLTWDANNLTLARNGKNINGAASNYTASVVGAKRAATALSAANWSVK